MITRYWSNTEFANKIRKIFGIKEQPYSASWEGWEAYDKECKEASLIGYYVIELLDNIQRAIHWPANAFSSAIYWLHNVFSGSHTLRTNVKIGGYSDLVTKIPDALMYAVIDFVETECFWMNIMSTKEPGLLYDYANQSYLRRKLFPVKVPDYIRGSEGIKWLEFQMEAQPGESPDTNRYYDPLIAAYKFAKSRYFKFDAWEESGYNEAERAGILPPMFLKNNDIRLEYYKKIRELEEIFDDEVTVHCTNIINLRKGMWT